MNVVITELIKDRERGRRHVKLQKSGSSIIENKKQWATMDGLLLVLMTKV